MILKALATTDKTCKMGEMRLWPLTFVHGCLRCAAVALLAVGGVLAAPPTQDLHYLVVDRSGSIGTSHLTQPLTDAIKRHVNTLGEDAEVRIVFFSEQAQDFKVWPSMTFDAKIDFGRYFEKKFRPKGETHLFDTAAQVVDEVAADAGAYRGLKVMILSDGEDSTNGHLRSWQPVVDKVCKLMRDNPNSLVRWYTIGWDPTDAPTDCIQVTKLDPADIKIPPDPPTAAFEAAPCVVRPGEPVTFLARHSIGQIETLEWSFGDGATARGPLVSHDVVKHAYTNTGPKTVGLVVSGIGGKDTFISNAYIQVQAVVHPEARFTWEPVQPRVGQRLHFINESIGSPVSYTWTFGDVGTSPDPSPAITPSVAGPLPVKLMVSKGDESHTAGVSVVVLPLEPDANFDMDPKGELELGQTLRLTAVSQESGVQHQWTLNGSTVLTGRQVEWVADEAGPVDVLHLATGDGGVSPLRKQTYVKTPERPDADFSISPEPVEAKQDVTLQARHDGPGWIHRWQIGERQETGARIVLPMEVVGSVPAIHEVIDRGMTGRLDKAITVVENLRLVPRFEASPRRGKAPLAVQFEDETEGVVTANVWDFGDGESTNNSKSTRHEYRKPGSYSVTLAVENKVGQRTVTTEPLTITVKAPPPVWLLPTIIGAFVLVALLVLWSRIRPQAPGGTLTWEVPGEARPKTVDVRGTVFDLGGLGITNWKADGKYAIAVRGGKRVLLKDGEVFEELGRDKRFRVGGTSFKYLNALLEE